VTNAGSFAGHNVDAVRRALAARFRDFAIDSAELDARILTGAVLGLDFTAMLAAASRCLSDDEAARLEDYVSRRISGEPLARILGSGEFWGLPLCLSPATLIPRPDTETVVEAALEILRAQPKPGDPLRLADLGTGSGAILLALLSELPAASGIGTDLSEAALQTARGNARQLGLLSRSAFVACDYSAALAGPFDLIVSNPPYIRSADIAALDVEVRNYDPCGALDGGPDGLDAYRAIIPDATRLLVPGGALVVEVGQGQSSDLQGLMAAAGFVPVGPPRTDLAGIPRAVSGLFLPR
jgi:release factor glutamine methyltransferase